MSFIVIYGFYWYYLSKSGTYSTLNPSELFICTFVVFPWCVYLWKYSQNVWNKLETVYKSFSTIYYSKFWQVHCPGKLPYSSYFRMKCQKWFKNENSDGNIPRKLAQYTTGWTNTNLLYFPDAIEITFLEGLTFNAQNLTNQNGHWHDDARFSWLEGNDLPLRSRSTWLISDLRLQR